MENGLVEPEPSEAATKTTTESGETNRKAGMVASSNETLENIAAEKGSSVESELADVEVSNGFVAVSEDEVKTESPGSTVIEENGNGKPASGDGITEENLTDSEALATQSSEPTAIEKVHSFGEKDVDVGAFDNLSKEESVSGEASVPPEATEFSGVEKSSLKKSKESTIKKEVASDTEDVETQKPNVVEADNPAHDDLASSEEPQVSAQEDDNSVVSIPVEGGALKEREGNEEASVENSTTVVDETTVRGDYTWRSDGNEQASSVKFSEPTNPEVGIDSEPPPVHEASVEDSIDELDSSISSPQLVAEETGIDIEPSHVDEESKEVMLAADQVPLVDSSDSIAPDHYETAEPSFHEGEVLEGRAADELAETVDPPEPAAAEIVDFSESVVPDYKEDSQPEEGVPNELVPEEAVLEETEAVDELVSTIDTPKSTAEPIAESSDATATDLEENPELTPLYEERIPKESGADEDAPILNPPEPAVVEDWIDESAPMDILSNEVGVKKLEEPVPLDEEGLKSESLTDMEALSVDSREPATVDNDVSNDEFLSKEVASTVDSPEPTLTTDNKSSESSLVDKENSNDEFLQDEATLTVDSPESISAEDDIDSENAVEHEKIPKEREIPDEAQIVDSPEPSALENEDDSKPPPINEEDLKQDSITEELASSTKSPLESTTEDDKDVEPALVGEDGLEVESVADVGAVESRELTGTEDYKDMEPCLDDFLETNGGIVGDQEALTLDHHKPNSVEEDVEHDTAPREGSSEETVSDVVVASAETPHPVLAQLVDREPETDLAIVDKVGSKVIVLDEVPSEVLNDSHLDSTPVKDEVFKNDSVDDEVGISESNDLEDGKDVVHISVDDGVSKENVVTDEFSLMGEYPERKILEGEKDVELNPTGAEALKGSVADEVTSTVESPVSPLMDDKDSKLAPLVDEVTQVENKNVDVASIRESLEPTFADDKQEEGHKEEFPENYVVSDDMGLKDESKGDEATLAEVSEELSTTEPSQATETEDEVGPSSVDNGTLNEQKTELEIDSTAPISLETMTNVDPVPGREEISSEDNAEGEKVQKTKPTPVVFDPLTEMNGTSKEGALTEETALTTESSRVQANKGDDFTTSSKDSEDVPHEKSEEDEIDPLAKSNSEETSMKESTAVEIAVTAESRTTESQRNIDPAPPLQKISNSESNIDEIVLGTESTECFQDESVALGSPLVVTESSDVKSESNAEREEGKVAEEIPLTSDATMTEAERSVDPVIVKEISVDGTFVDKRDAEGRGDGTGVSSPEDDGNAHVAQEDDKANTENETALVLNSVERPRVFERRTSRNIVTDDKTPLTEVAEPSVLNKDFSVNPASPDENPTKEDDTESEPHYVDTEEIKRAQSLEEKDVQSTSLGVDKEFKLPEGFQKVTKEIIPLTEKGSRIVSEEAPVIIDNTAAEPASFSKDSFKGVERYATDTSIADVLAPLGKQSTVRLSSESLTSNKGENHEMLKTDFLLTEISDSGGDSVEDSNNFVNNDKLINDESFPIVSSAENSSWKTVQAQSDALPTRHNDEVRAATDVLNEDQESVPLSTHSNDLSSSWVRIAPTQPSPGEKRARDSSEGASERQLTSPSTDLRDWRIVSEHDVPRTSVSKSLSNSTSQDSGGAKFPLSLVLWCSQSLSSLFGH